MLSGFPTLLTSLMRKGLLFLVVLLLAVAPTVAPTVAQDLESPSSFLGYEIGSRFSRHHQVVDYFEHVAEASDRVQLIPYGTTNEGRPLLVAVVSSTRNMTRLESIRHDNLRLANLEEGDPEGTPPAIVWLSFNVHGNESNSTEASMTTLFALADPSSERSAEWLENTVVVLDPAINPDGRDRYANWYNMMVGESMDADPVSVEHAEPWPGGRTNHYYFDLNRDWSWQTQVETRQRMTLYRAWMPHVHVDFHEQGVNSPYFFAPAAEPVHEEVTDWQREFQEIIGRNHARYFDAEGWLYFTKEVFDILYPGYGDSFPMFNGAIGMTYEQAGGGGAGLGVQTALGDTLSLLDRLTHHASTGLSTVEMASVHRERLTNEFASYFDRSLSDPPGQYKAYVISASSPGNRMAEVARHLDLLGIDYAAASGDMTVEGLNYRSGSSGRHRVSSGDLVVPASQPRAVLTRVLFDPEVAITDSITYDITAWAIPYAYDVNAIASLVTIPTSPWLADAPGGAISELDEGDAKDVPYAWVFPWDDAGDATFLAALFKADMIVRRNDAPFTVKGVEFGRGSLIVTRRNNEHLGADIASLIQGLAAEFGQHGTAVPTGYVDEGKDLGSSSVRAILPPRVGMPFGSPLSSSGIGEIWHLFDQVLDYPITRFPVSRFASIDLDEFDIILMPSGSYGSVLNDAGLKRITEWVRGGGRLVALDRAASWLAGKEGMALTVKSSDPEPDSSAAENARSRRYEDRNREGSESDNPGAIYRVDMDDSHPLAFGFSDETFILRSRSDHPEIMKGSGNWNVGIVQDDGRMSGHTGYRAEERIEGSLAFGVQSVGRGEIVFLLDNILFRGFWRSGRMLMANAIFMAGQ